MSEKSMAIWKNKKKTFVLICFGILLIILGVVSWKLFFTSYDGAVTARIYQDGKLIYTIPLDHVEEDYEIFIKNENGGENTIFVSRGKISVSHADCPDQICVKRGQVSYSGVPIVCMPNKLVIQFEKEGKASETDTEINSAGVHH